MKDTLDAISYLGGLIFGIVFIICLILGITALVVSRRLDKLQAQFREAMDKYEREHNESE